MKAPTPEEIRDAQEWQRREAEKSYQCKVRKINADLGEAETIAHNLRLSAEKEYHQEMYRIANPNPSSLQFRASRATYAVIVSPDSLGSWYSIDHQTAIIALSPTLATTKRHEIVHQALCAAAFHLNPGVYSIEEQRAVDRRIDKTMNEDMDRQGGKVRLTCLKPAQITEQKRQRKESIC